MKKKIKVILLEDNIKKGPKGSIINVARGYAFNYLIPNKTAELATKKKVKHINKIQSILKDKEKAYEMETKSLKDSIERITHISVHKKKGENQSIFGNITEKEIMKWMIKYSKLTIQKVKIQNLSTKMIGIGKINIEFNQKINVDIPIHIVPTNI